MEIKISKNNNKALSIEFTSYDGTPYDVPIDTVIKFTVKKSVTDSDNGILFSKTIIGDGGSDYTINITSDDTNLPCGIYWWDLKNVTDGVTITDPDKLIIKEVVRENE